MYTPLVDDFSNPSQKSLINILQGSEPTQTVFSCIIKCIVKRRDPFCRVVQFFDYRFCFGTVNAVQMVKELFDLQMKTYLDKYY